VRLQLLAWQFGSVRLVSLMRVQCSGRTIGCCHLLHLSRGGRGWIWAL